MKRIIMLLAMMTLPWCVVANTETVDGITWTFTVSDGKASVGTGFWDEPAISQSTTGVITIPSTLGGYPVTRIGRGAFFRCSGLTSVTIPEGVTSIGDEAFCYCWGLTSVTIPEGVTNIGDRAFYNCSVLTSVTIPEGVTSIEYGAFEGCSGLTSVTIPESVTSIEYGAFEGCSGLTSVTIPESVTSIGSCAFSGCSGLTSVTIPSSVTSIGSNAFYNCSGLTSVTIPEGVTSIEESAFSGCSGLISVTIPDKYKIASVFPDSYATLENVTIMKLEGKICDGAFDGCQCLTSVTISDGITEIGESTFRNCEKLEAITISALVTKIGAYAFAGCSELTSVTILSREISIDDSAFSACGSLKYVAMPLLPNMRELLSDAETSIENIILHDGTTTKVTEDMFSGFTSLTNIVLPSTVTSIGDSAFVGCTSLAEITIPESVFEIGSGVFGECTVLKRVTFEGDAPDGGGGLFYGTSKRLEVRVPRGSIGWGSGLSTELPDTWNNRVIVFSDEKYDWNDEQAVNALTVTFVSTNVVVHYVFNSVQPEFAIPASSDTGFQNIITEVKSGGAVSVPATWATNYPTFESKFGSDFTKALMQTTGKVDASGNPMYVWQDYVAGTDPTDAKDVFTASITIVDGKPVISYTPELDDERKALRKYVVYGKVDLSDANWVEVDDTEYTNYHFFKVTVEMR